MDKSETFRENTQNYLKILEVNKSQTIQDLILGNEEKTH